MLVESFNVKTLNLIKNQVSHPDTEKNEDLLDIILQLVYQINFDGYQFFLILQFQEIYIGDNMYCARKTGGVVYYR